MNLCWVCITEQFLHLANPAFFSFSDVCWFLRTLFAPSGSDWPLQQLAAFDISLASFSQSHWPSVVPCPCPALSPPKDLYPCGFFCLRSSLPSPSYLSTTLKSLFLVEFTWPTRRNQISLLYVFRAPFTSCLSYHS